MPSRPVLTCALVLVLCVAGCGAPTGPEQPAPSHDLVFLGILETVPELLLRDAVTGQVRRVLPAGTEVTDPAPSPDGTRIAFAVVDVDDGIGDIHVVGRDGTGLMQLTFDPELDDQPAWSPDGARIAFRSFRTRRLGDIWVMDADGGNPVNLTPDPAGVSIDEHHPAWSPDGTRLAYVSTAGGDNDIWTMAADGSDKRHLDTTTDLDTEPAWSPDGATIAYRRSGAADPGDIWLVPAAGGQATALGLAGSQRTPAWTPDGTQLVVAHRPVGQQRFDLYVLGIDGSAPRPLVTDEVPGGCLDPGFLRRP